MSPKCCFIFSSWPKLERDCKENIILVAFILSCIKELTAAHVQLIICKSLVTWHLNFWFNFPLSSRLKPTSSNSVILPEILYACNHTLNLCQTTRCMPLSSWLPTFACQYPPHSCLWHITKVIIITMRCSALKTST